MLNFTLEPATDGYFTLNTSEGRPVAIVGRHRDSRHVIACLAAGGRYSTEDRERLADIVGSDVVDWERERDTSYPEVTPRLWRRIKRSKLIEPLEV